MNKFISQNEIENSSEIDITNLIGKMLFFKTLEEETVIGVITGLTDITTHSVIINCYIFADNTKSTIWFNIHEVNRLSKNGFTAIDKIISYSVE